VIFGKIYIPVEPLINLLGVIDFCNSNGFLFLKSGKAKPVSREADFLAVNKCGEGGVNRKGLTV
jgi:hypothetical protein